MSGAQAEADTNRKERRTKTAPSVRDQQLAHKMKQVHDAGKVRRHEGESESDYFGRIRDKARQIMRHERAQKRKAAKAARKANR